MKKTLIIASIVAVVVVGTWFADRATRLAGKTRMEVPAKTALAAKPEPDLKFKDLQGKDVALADLKGKVVFLNFWATWCDPCRVEIPWLIAMQTKYGPQGFTVVGVAMDDEGKSVVAPFI